MNYNHYIKMFACCHIVKGANRSLICDSQRNDIKLIPNALFNLINSFDHYKIEELLNYYGPENRTTVTEYLEFLIEDEYAFYCNEDERSRFPAMKIDDFKMAGLISNAIYELSKIDYHQINMVITQLEEVQCKAIEIRICFKANFTDINYLLKFFTNSAIEEVILLFGDNKIDIEDLKSLFLNNLRLSTIAVGNCNENKAFTHFSNNINNVIYYLEKNILLKTCCGNFSPDIFIKNITFITEAQKFNTCLNRKVAIDVRGDVKNCPSLPTVFGNIFDNSIIDIIKTQQFQSVWRINKNHVNICKDCEFRYVCIDCRAYLEHPDDIYSKPLKCGYDPYTSTWEDWSTNPLKNNEIKYYEKI